MKNTSFFTLFLLLLSSQLAMVWAQSKTSSSSANDMALKESLYNQNRKEVLNYSMKEFDALFFEFFEKKAKPNLVLSKNEYYTYTTKIAAFSDRLASLYPKQKAIASASKKKWMDETYEDYLEYKAMQQK